MQNSTMHFLQKSLNIHTKYIQEKPIILNYEIKQIVLDELLCEKEQSWKANADAKFQVRLVQDEDIIKLSGKLEGVFNNQCIRCLNDANCSLNFTFNLNLVSNIICEKYQKSTVKNNKKQIDINEALLYEEESTAYYSNNNIDLAQILREQIFLNLPMYPICGDANLVNNNDCSNVHFINS